MSTTRNQSDFSGVVYLSLAVTLVVYGIYFMGPVYSTVDFESDTIRYIGGSLYVLSGMIALLGLGSNAGGWRRVGAFMMALSFTAALALRFIAYGVSIGGWVFILPLTFIASALYLYETVYWRSDRK